MNHYNKEEVEKIVRIFDRNNVKLEFDDLNNLIDCFSDVEQTLVTDALKSIFDQSKKVNLVELDLVSKQIVSTGIGYPYSTASFCYYPQLKQQLEIISDIFSYNIRASVDLFGTYMVMYGTKAEKSPENFYYILDRGLFLDVDNLSVFEILKSIGLSNKHIACLRTFKDKFLLDYIGFDLNNNLSKVCLLTSGNSLINSKYKIIFGDYIKFSEIISCFENLDVNIQYSPDNEKYIAFEISLFPSMVKESAQKLYDLKIISESTFENFNTLKISSDYQNAVLKFRWNDEKNFTIKLYLEQFF